MANGNRNLTAIFQFVLLLMISLVVQAKEKRDTVFFTMQLVSPSEHLLHIDMMCTTNSAQPLTLKMPQWTTGYYQILNYANRVKNFKVTDAKNNQLEWSKKDNHTWLVQSNKATTIKVSYDVLADTAFVATSIFDSTHAYINTSATCMYVNNNIQLPVSLTIKNYPAFTRIATGLDSSTTKANTYTANDFDVLYDCPILMGNLEELPSFTVHGITHRFIGYNMGDFDKQGLMNDLKKIVEASIKIIGDVPYKQYTFLGIGAGYGGIEHLNSTAVSFNGNGLNNDGARKRMLSFLAHEYFHNFNVKRIRPIELGPFDYDNGSKTKQLWISEGWTVYYEYMVLKRAGLLTDEDLYKDFTSNILAYETEPGRLFQSLAQASDETWDDGPFGRVNDEFNKTISYYDKGPVVALMMDFAIRNATKNKKSLDDVIRTLYNRFYQQQGRGFTEDEFKQVSESVAGIPLTEISSYVYTTNELNYTKYFNYAGLDIDTTTHILPGSFLGLHGRFLKDSIIITKVDWQSPAWNAGIRKNNVIVAVNNAQVSSATLQHVEAVNKPGDAVTFTVVTNGLAKNINCIVAPKTKRSFQIGIINQPNALQQAILQSWLSGKN
jgi:predicted metalloprotease with PDZ domain